MTGGSAPAWRSVQTAAPTQAATVSVLRYALVLVFLVFGYAKFFPYETKGFEPLIAAHPLLSWFLPSFGWAGASMFLSVVEIATGLLLASGRWFSRASAIGAIMGAFAFLCTVTLYFFLPGVFKPSAGGFPAISMTGGFLLKDAVLFGACLACLADSLGHMR